MLLNVHSASNVRQIKVHITEPSVPGASLLEVKIAIAKLKECKSLDSDQIPAELIEAGGKTLLSAIQKLDNFFEVRKNCLISGRGLLLCQFIKRVTKLTVIIIGRHYSINFIQHFII
jgi:hypothetical protein